MSKLLTLETIAGLSRSKADDVLYKGWVERIARTTEQQSRLLRRVPTGTAHPQAQASGLVVNGDTLTSITVTADEVWVKDIDNNPEVLTTINTTVAFADVLDTGALAASTWYYVWLIYNGTTSRVLISMSFTAPVMPDGYTHKGLLTALRITAGSALVRFFTQGLRTEITDTEVLTAGTATIATAVPLATAAPPIGRFVSGWAFVDATIAGVRATTISLDGARGIQRVQDNIVSTAGVSGNYRVAYSNSQIAYQNLVANNRTTIQVTAWEF